MLHRVNRFYVVVFWLSWLLSSNSWGRAKIALFLPLVVCVVSSWRRFFVVLIVSSSIYINVWITFYLLSGMLYFVCAWSLSIFIYICVWRSFRLPGCCITFLRPEKRWWQRAKKKRLKGAKIRAKSYIINIMWLFFRRVRVVFCRGTPPFNTIGHPYWPFAEIFQFLILNFSIFDAWNFVFLSAFRCCETLINRGISAFDVPICDFRHFVAGMMLNSS